LLNYIIFIDPYKVVESQRCKDMRKILCDKGSVRGLFKRMGIVYTNKFGRISKLNFDTKGLYEISLRTNGGKQRWK